jgi:tripartite-type tricarboxylate transporter receptor subunit TctC
MKMRLSAVLVGLTLVMGAGFAHAYPDKPVTWVLGFPPGGVSDSGTRMLAKALGDRLGQPVIVENKPGATGIVAAEAVAAAKPDGYTIMTGSNGAMAANKFLQKKLSYYPLESFTLLGGVATSPLILVVPESSPFKTIKDLVDHAKKNPTKLNYATVGSGSAAHLVTEMFAQKAGIELTHIPYKGTSAAIADLLGGRIDLMFDFSIVVKPQLDVGKLRALAQTGATRMTNHMDVPVFADVGFSGVEFSAWSVYVGPAKMPKPIVDKLSAAFGDVLKDPAVIKYYADQGAIVLPGMNPDKLRSFVQSEQTKYKGIIERAGITPD